MQKLKLRKVVHDYDIAFDEVRILETYEECDADDKFGVMTIEPGVAGATQKVTIKRGMSQDEAKAYQHKLETQNLRRNADDKIVIRTAAQEAGLT